jgi:hypothetical protein
VKRRNLLLAALLAPIAPMLAWHPIFSVEEGPWSADYVWVTFAGHRVAVTGVDLRTANTNWGSA